MTVAVAAAGQGPVLRIDKFLWFARLAKSRSVAQAMAERGIMRLNGRRVDRAHSPVRVGDLITLVLPHRRGPASEAALCYEELELGG